MKTFIDRKKIIQILFGISVILLVANLVFTKLYEKKDLKNEFSLTGKEINNSFLNFLETYAVKKDWIKNTIKTGEKDSVYSYSVDIPADLPIILIVKDIYNHFSGRAEIVSEEKKINNNAILKVYSDNQLKLSAEFKYNKKITRAGENFGFLLDDFFELNEDERYNILNSTETFAVLLIPSREAAEFADSLINYRKEYAVLLNDEIGQLDYKFNPSYSESRLKLSVRNLVADFSKAVFFIIDDKSDLYYSSVYPFLKEQLELRKIKLIRRSEVSEISSGSSGEMIKDFSNIVLKSYDNEKKLIIVPAEKFTGLTDEISRYRKTGNHFLNPSRIAFGGEN